MLAVQLLLASCTLAEITSTARISQQTPKMQLAKEVDKDLETPSKVGLHQANSAQAKLGAKPISTPAPEGSSSAEEAVAPPTKENDDNHS